MKFGIVIFPSKKLQDYANSFRKRYDPHYALIPPHITLKSAFEATEEEIGPIANKISEIAEKFNPVHLQVTKFSSFSPVNNVIYLKVDPTEELENLHEELKAAFKSETSYKFVPHITLGQEMSDAEHADVYGTLRLNTIQFDEHADRIHLLYQLDNGSWTVYETFRLGNASL
ncbi:2'-5' RNA ligase family protein [Bacillus massilinigeriensis]|uniref:2'-5' RNA ligase family protein n=1 Tax=Bacillus mediterraneensis TaxID=1805474 RepID=UPI0008F8A589|nr:2'-5' RNA ligase family protein [Bacillus mediterraneensis]